MATLLEDYIAKLTANTQPYTPLTEAQIAEKAKNKYQAVYDQNRLSAQQQYDANALARQQAMAELNAQYDLQQEQSRKNYADAQATALRNAVSRGMQRSSYLGATVGNIGIKGAEAQQAINRNREGSIKNYNEQNALAAQQLAAQLAQYDKSQLADQLAYQDELEQREYDRSMTAADRANQLAGDIYNAQLTAAQNNWWGMQGLLGVPSSGGSGGYDSGSSGSKKSYTPAPTNQQTLNDLLNGKTSSVNAASTLAGAVANAVSAAAVKNNQKKTSGGGSKNKTTVSVR